MGATADTIWEVPAYLPCLQPPLTDEAVANAEEQIRHTLPAAYLALLKKQNGGYIRFSLPNMTQTHRMIAGIGPNFPSLTPLDDLQEYVSFPLQGLVEFDGDGHWYLCLDYRENSGIPSVTYANIEGDYRESRVAESFADYLSMLQIDIGDDEYVLEAVSDIEAVKAELSASIGISFEPPSDWAFGYLQHGARLGTETNPKWVWISPNDVPRGFVRANEPKYMELKDLMPGYAARFTELPPNSYILSTPEDVRPRAIKACTRSGLIVRPLREYVNWPFSFE